MDFDYGKLLATTGGDEDLAKELINIGLDQCELTLEGIVQAVQGKQAEDLHHTAHKLKGSLQCLGAGTSLVLVMDLETMAINGDLRQAESTLEKLKPALNTLMIALQNTEGVTTK